MTGMTSFTFRIKDLEDHGKDVHASLPAEFLADALTDQGTDQSRSQVRIDAHLSKQGRNVMCDGRLSGRLTMTCQRCLGPAELPVEARLHTMFAPPTAVSVDKASGRGGRRFGESTEIDADDEDLAASDVDDEDYSHHDGEVVDLAPLVREYVILAVPMTVLCKEDCRGLCPSCGVDRNTTACACQPAQPLSAFSALKDLKI